MSEGAPAVSTMAEYQALLALSASGVDALVNRFRIGCIALASGMLVGAVLDAIT